MSGKILLLGFLDSPHFARWLEILLQNTNYYFLLFGSSPARRLNPKLFDLMRRYYQRVSGSADSTEIPVITYLSDKLLRTSFLIKKLETCLSKNKFELIHFFEMQHSGYRLDQINNKPDTKYANSSYGSDIFWFGRYRSHKNKIRFALKNVDLIFLQVREIPRAHENLHENDLQVCKDCK